MKPKTVMVWLCRDVDGDYVVCPLLGVKPRRLTHSHYWTQCNKEGAPVHSWLTTNQLDKAGAKLFGHLKLKPGEGPRKIEITAKFVD